ncbi:MAG: hypothetical protein KKC42_01445, partial [Candidatus Omnitrophica bacterium]|nr:hypothetical protein [Candidatus Omnitrophota bacterium]
WIIIVLLFTKLTRQKICPDCKRALPKVKFERPHDFKDFKQRFLLGQICQDCGCIVDDKGNKISHEERVEQSIKFLVRTFGFLFIISSLKYIISTIVIISVSFLGFLSYLEFNKGSFTRAAIFWLKDLISYPGIFIYLIFNIIVFLFGGIGLLKLRKWARNLFIFMTPVILIMHFLFIDKNAFILLSVVMYILLLYFFTRRKVIEQFKSVS